MRALALVIADREVRIVNPAGTDLVFRTEAHVCLNDGDASRGTVAGAKSARDREEEIPCGVLRVLPEIDSVEGEMVFKRSFGWPALGYGLNIDRFIGDGLRIVFEKGRVRRIATEGDQKALDKRMDCRKRRQGPSRRIGGRMQPTAHARRRH
jgi:leucyl aminopeptidase (aminopeptidase T)